MSQLDGSQASAGQSLPEGLEIEIPDDLLPVPPVSLPIGDGSLFGLFATVAAGLLSEINVGTVLLRRRTNTRERSWKQQISSAYTDYELVCYVTGKKYERVGGALKVRYEMMVSAPHLVVSSILPSDLIVMNGVEYVILGLDLVPEEGTQLIYWDVTFGIG